jgi:hypothetical protein
MAKGKHNSRSRPTAEIINTATDEIINPPTDEQIPINIHQKPQIQHNYRHKIVLNSHRDKVEQIWVRFGTLDRNGNHNWVRTMAMGPVKINPGQREIVAMVDDDQLPAAADSCYYQLLCEILTKCKGKDKHMHPEILMTPPTKVMSARKH